MPTSSIARTMQATHWSRSLTPIANGMWRARRRGWPNFDKQVGSAEPAGEEHVELVARALQVVRVHRAQFGELGDGFHQRVETVAQAGNPGVAADLVVSGLFVHEDCCFNGGFSSLRADQVAMRGAGPHPADWLLRPVAVDR